MRLLVNHRGQNLFTSISGEQVPVPSGIACTYQGKNTKNKCLTNVYLLNKLYLD